MGKQSWVLCVTIALQQIILLAKAEDGYNYSPPRVQLTYPSTKVEYRQETVVCKDLITERPPKDYVPERIVERVPFIPEEHLKRDEKMREIIEDQKVRIDDQVRELGDQRQKIVTQTETIVDRTEEIRTKDRTIGDLNDRIDDQTRRIDNQDQEINQQRDTIRDRDREIERKDVTIETQRIRIEEQNNNIDDRDRQIREQRETIAERNRDVDDRDRTITTHLETIDMLVEELRRLRAAPNLGVVLGDRIIEFIESEKQKVTTTDTGGGVEVTQRRTQQRVTTTSGGGGGDSGGSFRESSRSSSSSSRTSSGSGSSGNTDNEDELNFNSVGGGLEFPSGSTRFTSRIPLIPLGGYSSSRKSEKKISSATVNRPSIVYGPPNLEASASTTSFKSVSRLKEKGRTGLRSSRNPRVNRHASIPHSVPRQSPPTLSPNRRSQDGATKLIRTNGYRSYLIVPSG